MKVFHIALAAALILCGFGLSPAQELKTPILISPEEIGARLVDAIKNRDIAPFMEFVSESGIDVGIDGPTIPAAIFRNQLRQKRGVYCDIMGGLCSHDPNKSKIDDSLRGLILRQPIKLEYHSVGGIPNEIEVRAMKEASPDEVLFSLFLDKKSGGWRLVGIEYD